MTRVVRLLDCTGIRIGNDERRSHTTAAVPESSWELALWLGVGLAS